MRAAFMEQVPKVQRALVTTSAQISYYIPDRTRLDRQLVKGDEDGKELMWIVREGVPCRLVRETEDAVVLHSFTAAPGSTVRIPRTEFEEQFVKAEMDGDFILGLEKYPGGKLHVSEFDKRKEAPDLVAAALKVVPAALYKKVEFLDKSQGNTKAMKTQPYMDYKAGRLVAREIENLGDPIFNRSPRWAPPINMSHDTFKKTRGFPAPVGIRPKDYCRPSEAAAVVADLLVQMACFENVEPGLRTALQKIVGVDLPTTIHCCTYCGGTVDATKCTSEYKSETNYIELCHRDPNVGFVLGNMYWGHGDCNRRQGGYTESDVVADGGRLALLHPEHRAAHIEWTQALLMKDPERMREFFAWLQGQVGSSV